MTERSTVYRLAAATNLDARAVGRVLRGEYVRPSTRTAVEGAARRLRIKLPGATSASAAARPPRPARAA